jgi:dTDP-4-dehydrorhamnose reductase
MKIVIFGSNGMLGNYVAKVLEKNFEVIRLTRKNYDLSFLSIDTLKKLLLDLNFKKDDVIINCAGIIPQAHEMIKYYKYKYVKAGIVTQKSNLSTLNKHLYYKVNTLFPIVLSCIVNELNGKMIHITTDCVFSGNVGNYYENSNHDETSDYGMSKSLGEICNSTIIRTSIIGEELRNKRSLLEWVKSNKEKEIDGYNNHKWNGITCLKLAQIIEEIICKNNFWKGVRHIFTKKSVTKYELVNIINKVYDLNIKVNKFETQNIVNKTLNTIYDKNQFEIPDIETQIVELKRFNLES